MDPWVVAKSSSSWFRVWKGQDWKVNWRRGINCTCGSENRAWGSLGFIFTPTRESSYHRESTEHPGGRCLSGGCQPALSLATPVPVWLTHEHGGQGRRNGGYAWPRSKAPSLQGWSDYWVQPDRSKHWHWGADMHCPWRRPAATWMG